MSLNIDFNNMRSLGPQNEGFEELVCSWRAECMSQPASASCAMDGLTADLSLMEIPKGQMRFSLQAADRESELFDYMFGNFYGSGSTSHY